MAARHFGANSWSSRRPPRSISGTADGSAIHIEERDPRELTEYMPVCVSPRPVWPPRIQSPDVTPASLIDVIVTERWRAERPRCGAHAGHCAIMKQHFRPQRTQDAKKSTASDLLKGLRLRSILTPQRFFACPLRSLRTSDLFAYESHRPQHPERSDAALLGFQLKCAVR